MVDIALIFIICVVTAVVVIEERTLWAKKPQCGGGGENTILCGRRRWYPAEIKFANIISIKVKSN